MQRRAWYAVVALAWAASIFQLDIASAAQPAPNEAPAAAKRPRVALVLSGGGARGLSHIGVLKVLREMRVPYDFIVATSMGSIVGGASSAGHTPEEMEALVGAADWQLLFSDRVPRELLSWRRKEDDLRLIGKSELGIKSSGVVLPRGALGSQNLEEFLRAISRPASEVRHQDQFPVPLVALATDLETGQPVVLRDAPLAVAMRASMSIPGAFAPTVVDGRLLADGGLTRNLPVEVARELGADIVIAVNVGTPLLPREALASAFGVAQQMINILTEQNVALSLEALRPRDVLISPDLAGVTFLDFQKSADLVARGEAAARAAAARLAALAVDKRTYDLWEFARTRHPVEYDRDVHAVRVTGAVRTNPEALAREVADRTGIVPGQSVSDAQMIRAARILHGSGEFERVDVHAELDGKQKNVVIDVDEKPWGPDYLRVGGVAVADFRTEGRFSLVVQHTRTWVNSFGAEWRNEVEFGDVRRLMTSFYQPMGPGSPWYLEPSLYAVQSDRDIFGPRNHRTDRVTQGISGASAAFGRRLWDSAVARVRLGYERYRSTPLIGPVDRPTTRDSAWFARLEGQYDTLDDPHFPRRGLLVGGNVANTDYRAGGGAGVQTLELQALAPVTFDRLTFLGIANYARSRDDRGGFALGGFLNLSGTPQGAIAGPQAASLAGLAYYRMGDLPRAVGSAWYAGVSLEAANAWSGGRSGFGDYRTAASVYLGVDSIIGALYLGYGRTFGGDSALYLFLGNPSDRR